MSNKQLLDEVEHDIRLRQITQTRGSRGSSHSASEENTPRGLVTRQMLNLA